MELSRWQGATRRAVPRVIVLLAGIAVSGACGPSQSVAADAPPPATATVAAVDGAADVLAGELRDAAVQALRLPEPIVAVVPSDDDQVELAVEHSWETVDLMIRSVEQNPTEVIVFASPVRAEWDLGDGNALSCDEFGNMDGDGDCVHTYPQHGRFEGEIELVWGLSWSLDGEHQGIFETTSTGASFVVNR